MSRQKRQHLKKRPDGRYVCYYHDKAFYGKTELEALAARDEYKTQEKAGTLVKASPYTVGGYAMQWLPVHKKGVKDSTFNNYVACLKNGLKPIENIRLADLSTDDIATAYAGLVGRSAGSIAQFRALLTAILDSAVDAEYIKRNPCRASSVKAPAGKSGGHRCITHEERQIIISTPHRLRPLAVVMLYAGLRRGEALALQPEDIRDGYIYVDKAVSCVAHRPSVSTPKTPGSVRRVPVPVAVSKLLDDLEPLPIMRDDAFADVWRRYMADLSKAAGRPVSIRCHDLRVSYCTMIRDAGIDIKQAMIWMGHADEKMILRVYDQPGEEREKQSEKLLNQLVNGQNDGRKVKRKRKSAGAAG